MKMENQFITETCEKCKGEGFLLSKIGISVEVSEVCWACKGLGKTPNTLGKQILELNYYFGRKR